LRKQSVTGGGGSLTRIFATKLAGRIEERKNEK
jgi:hypothetical protein